VIKTGTKKSAKTTKKNRAELIGVLIEQAELRIQDRDYKITVGDFIRLLQYEKEVETDQPKEIRVTWIEPPKPESENEA